MQDTLFNLIENDIHRFGTLINALTAAFMTAVSVIFILISDEGFRINRTVSDVIGLCSAAVLFSVYPVFLIRLYSPKAL